MCVCVCVVCVCVCHSAIVYIYNTLIYTSKSNFFPYPVITMSIFAYYYLSFMIKSNDEAPVVQYKSVLTGIIQFLKERNIDKRFFDRVTSYFADWYLQI